MSGEVVAHYGSAAAEIAVCSKAVGLVERSELDLLAVAGDNMALEHALAHAVPGAVPAPGHAACVADTWCCRVEPERALVAGGAGAVDRWRQVVSRAAAHTGTTISAGVLAGAGALSMVGPKAVSVLASAALPADLGPAQVADGRLAGSPVSVLCEDRERYLLLFPEGCPSAALDALGHAGRAVGLARVGHEALAHMRAARGGASLNG